MNTVSARVGKGDTEYDAEETARRRDEVVHRMANTPPQPKANPRPKKRRKAALDRGAGRGRVTHAP